jgi:hypothetical protein
MSDKKIIDVILIFIININFLSLKLMIRLNFLFKILKIKKDWLKIQF